MSSFEPYVGSIELLATPRALIIIFHCFKSHHFRCGTCRNTLNPAVIPFSLRCETKEIYHEDVVSEELLDVLPRHQCKQIFLLADDLSSRQHEKLRRLHMFCPEKRGRRVAMSTFAPVCKKRPPASDTAEFQHKLTRSKLFRQVPRSIAMYPLFLLPTYLLRP